MLKSWESLFDVNILNPLHTHVQNVLSVMFARPFDCKTRHISCIYFTDMCVSELIRKENVDVFNIFDLLMEYLMHKNVNLAHVIGCLRLNA